MLDKPVTAEDIIQEALDTLKERGTFYDTNGDGKERSLHRVAEIANLLLAASLKRGYLTGEDIGLLLIILKLVRSQQGDFRPDSFVDIAGYAGLTAEAAYDELQKPLTGGVLNQPVGIERNLLEAPMAVPDVVTRGAQTTPSPMFPSSMQLIAGSRSRDAIRKAIYRNDHHLNPVGLQVRDHGEELLVHFIIPESNLLIRAKTALGLAKMLGLKYLEGKVYAGEVTLLEKEKLGGDEKLDVVVVSYPQRVMDELSLAGVISSIQTIRNRLTPADYDCPKTAIHSMSGVAYYNEKTLPKDRKDVC